MENEHSKEWLEGYNDYFEDIHDNPYPYGWKGWEWEYGYEAAEREDAINFAAKVTFLTTKPERQQLTKTERRVRT